MKIYPIVEGYGEVEAAPVLLRRLLTGAQCHSVDVGKPIRRTQAQMTGKEGIQTAVKLAILKPDCAAVVIIFDGEDSCPKELAGKVRVWAQAAAGKVPSEVVVAYREYETWFLAAIESLRGKYGIRNDAIAPDDPEARRDAKSALEEFMPRDRAYSETGDQPGMSATFNMGIAYRRNRSFRKLVKAVGDVLRQLGQPLQNWPPKEWLA